MKKSAKVQEQLTRDSVLKLLSDNEIASVSTSETAPRLPEGDEYLDLDQLDQGVRHARGTVAPMGTVLPRKAVRAKTWNKILSKLGTPVT